MHLQQNLFYFFLVTLVELVDTACSIYQHRFASEEGMRCIGNFQLDQRVFVAIFPFYFFCR